MQELIAWLRVQLDRDAREYEESRALVPGDLHWSMPAHLDRDFLLADIEATRQIIEFFDDVIDDVAWYFEDEVLRRIALRYAKRDGYREEWRP